MAPNRGVSLIQVPSSDADADTDIDIIAIHGLDTKSPDTWISKAKYPDEDVNWLECPRMLPERAKSARIFMCDWPADLLEQPDLIQKTAEEFARLFLAGIKRRPLPKGEDRPIVFIASCLGGIILIEALLAADRPSSEYTAVRRSTRGIVFLATPFRGTSFQDVANWAEPGLRAWASIRGQKVSNLLDNVKGSTFHLEELVRRFTQLCQDKAYPCQVLTFYETGMTSLHRKFPLSWLIPSWLLDPSSQPKPLVDRSSATLDIVPDPLPLDRPHVMMNKFKGPEDPDYQCVAGKIEEMLQNIRKNSLLDDADAWIRNKHYTVDRLKIERLSGDQLSMDQCYINLAVVEQRGHGEDRPKEGDIEPSPFSIFNRQKVETPDKSIQVELATIFNQRKGRNATVIQPRRILIRGRAGVGKTTLCKKIVHEFTQGTWSEWNNLFDRILWVPLRNLKLEERRQSGYDFERLLAHEYFSLPNNKPHFARELACVLEKTNSSKTLLLLDGLDEVSQDLVGEDGMSRFLEELLKQPNIIVTSRPSGRLPPDLDLTLETIGFYPDQVKEYIRKAFTNPKTTETDQQTVDNVQSFLQGHWLIQGLVRIPIQLDALCYSWKDIPSDMPGTMTSLYQAIELSLWKKDILRLEKTHDGSLVTPGHIRDASRQDIEGFVKDEVSFLESLAFIGLRSNVIEFKQEHLNLIPRPSPGFWPPKTVPRLSFLRTSNPSSEGRNQSYHFIHLTFQEYFAARYIKRQWVARETLSCVELHSREIDKIDPVNFFQKHKYTARYDILWRFVAGLLDTEKEELSRFFQKMEEEPLDLLGPTHQRLVMHCLSEVSNSLPIRGDLEQRLSKWLLFECEFEQNRRVHLAGEVEFPKQIMEAVFREGSDKIKIKILRSLTKRATIPASIVEQAVSWLEHDDEDFRQVAVWALGQQSALPDEVFKAIVVRFEDKHYSVQEAAINALNQQPALLYKVLIAITARLEDKDILVRRGAIRILDMHSDLPHEILMAVAARLKDGDIFIQRSAMKILGLQSAWPHEIIKAIIILLEDKDRYVQIATIKALSQQSVLPHEVLMAVAARLEDTDCGIQAAAIKTLSWQSALPHEVLMAIIARLENKDSSIQEAAIKALGWQSALPYEVFMAIVARLEDKNCSIQASAIATIGKQSVLSQQLALPYKILKNITAQLKNEDFFVQKAAIEALGQQSALPYETLKAITALLDENQAEFFQGAAIKALSQQSTLPYEILESVAAQLENKSKYIRAAAETALRRHGEFYCSLFKGSYIKSIYGILLQRSFEEQLSWYVDDGNIYINMPEDIRRISIDNYDDIKATIETARPANFPIR